VIVIDSLIESVPLRQLTMLRGVNGSCFQRIAAPLEISGVGVRKKLNDNRICYSWGLLGQVSSALNDVESRMLSLFFRTMNISDGKIS